MGLDEDFALALALENEDQDLICEPKRKQNMEMPPSTSLADPSWELIDPTPDIFALFIAFDLRFFWGKLKSVIIRWSKRMYSCAGICSYSGRCGMCTISLSEPLLKLRPRKDLIETLLHEMIHAYLFVTHNNKDRSGHGPEFHKHMYRINDEAGVNITVYHSFHDEVNVYKTHWWRCDGPCRSKAPYFGTVKRTMNRAPGPSDVWWQEHQTNCGGTWHKIKEPEPKKKVAPKQDGANIHSFGDMTKYVKKGNEGLTSNRGGTLVITKPTQVQTKIMTPKEIKSDNNQKTILDYMNNPSKSNVETPISTHVKVTSGNSWRNATNGNLVNVIGFKDLNSDKAAITNVSVKRVSGSGNTLVPANSGKNPKNESPEVVIEVVRNHWANKYPDSNANATNHGSNKRRKIIDGYIEIKDDEEDNKDLTKKNNPRILDTIIIEDNDSLPEIESVINIKNEADDQNNVYKDKDELEMKPFVMKVNCPICNKIVNENDINEHLDGCVIPDNDKSLISELDGHDTLVKDFLNKNDDNDISLISEFNGDDTLVKDFLNKSGDKPVLIKCPICNKELHKNDLSNHLEICDKFDFTQNDKNCAKTDPAAVKMLKDLGYTEIDINNFMDKENDPKPSSSTSNNITGIQNIIQNVDQDYLNNSVNINFINGKQNIDDENEDYLGDLSQSDDIPEKFPCPVCFKIISLEDMNAHLDVCLNI